MSTFEHDEDETAIAVAENGHASPSSIFELLKAKRAAHVVERTYDVDVPGYGGLLVIRCGSLPGSWLSKTADRRETSRSPERDFNANADTLIAACREVLARPSIDDELQPLDEDEPMQIDERLAEGLGIDVTRGRLLVRQLFGAAPIPELALGDAMGGYIEWARAVNADADEAFAGEAPAASS